MTFDGSGSADPDPDGTITSHNWDFGDETKVGGEVVLHTYENGGIYHVILSVTDNEEATDSTFTIANIGEQSLRPRADAGGPYTGTVGERVTFDGTGSSDQDGTIEQYDWDFGDETMISGLAQPSHAYGAAGTYFVTLTVTDDTGETDENVAVVSIREGDLPVEADAGPPVFGTVGSPVTFDGSNSNDPDDEITQYLWRWGDGTEDPADAVAVHTYDEAGEYTVELLVTSASGSVSDTTTASIAEADANTPPTSDPGGPYSGEAGVAVSFDGSGSSDEDGSIVSYAWEFGDGDSGTGVTVDHTYATANSYLVKLTVTDDEGGTAVQTTSAAIDTENQAPTAVAGGPYSSSVNAAIQFTGSNSTDDDGTIVAYAWEFGDAAGGTSDSANPTYSYAQPGVYEATLTVTDDDGAQGQERATVLIGDGNEPPVANANGPYSGSAGEPVSFDGSASTDADGEVVTWNWDFGDGQTGTGSTIEHTYATAGSYHVILLVTDDDGSTRAALTSAEIGVASQPPTANPGGPYNTQVNVPLTFDGSASRDPDGTIVQYDWDFGDGSPALIDGGSAPTYTYATVNEYTVKLTVTDDDGETNTNITNVVVAIGNLPPQADAGPITFAQTGTTVTFDGTASSDPDGPIVRYDWVFGDGDSASDAGPTPEHVYETADTYNVTLTVTDADGTLASDVTQATVSDPSLVFSSMLPSSRSVQVGTLATVYGAIANGGTSAASQCGIAPQTAIDADFSYQTVNVDGVLTGVANTPADIPVGGVQNYAITFVPRSAFGPIDVEFQFDCVNTEPAAIAPGLNTLLFSSSTAPVPDVIGLSATQSNDGVVSIPESNVSAFAVATSNAGATADITVIPDAGDTPLSVTICETNPATGVCVNPPTPAASTTINMPAAGTNTLSVFVTATGDVPFDPGNSRITVRFEDSDGVQRGSTSVAVTTD